jgi:hypothetical protein
MSGDPNEKKPGSGIHVELSHKQAQAFLSGVRARGALDAVVEMAKAHARPPGTIPEVTPEACAACSHHKAEHFEGGACLHTDPECPECGCERFQASYRARALPDGFEPVEAPTATAIKKSRWQKGPECRHASWLHCPTCLFDGKVAGELASALAPSRSKTAALEEPFALGDPPREPEVRVADMRQIGKQLCVCGHELLSHAGGADKCTMLIDEGPRRGETCACTRFRSKSTEGAMAAAFLRGQRATEDESKPPRNLEQQRIWAGYFAAFLAQDLWTVEEAEEKAEAAFERHQRRWGG